MPLFQALVVETLSVGVIYVVDADTLEQAEEKMKSGDTVGEYAQESTAQVLNRTISGEIEETPDEDLDCFDDYSDEETDFDPHNHNKWPEDESPFGGGKWLD